MIDSSDFKFKIQFFLIPVKVFWSLHSVAAAAFVFSRAHDKIISSDWIFCMVKRAESISENCLKQYMFIIEKGSDYKIQALFLFILFILYRSAINSS